MSMRRKLTRPRLVSLHIKRFMIGLGEKEGWVFGKDSDMPVTGIPVNIS